MTPDPIWFFAISWRLWLAGLGHGTRHQAVDLEVVAQAKLVGADVDEAGFAVIRLCAGVALHTPSHRVRTPRARAASSAAAISRSATPRP